MFVQDVTPLGSLGLSALVAVLPLATVLVLLGVVRMRAHHAALLGLLVALVVGIAAFGMPVIQAVSGALSGAAFGLWPIMWIVVNALWIFNMTEATGHFAVLRRAFRDISDDTRVQAIVIAFCFGALLEALAGFGTPVAICSVMLLGIGLKPIRAVSVALVANTAPVAFGAIAIPIVTLGQV
ncbi:MAG TPA: L-lactate permease, partial [Amycolatopsis sp.]|uniref:L-lactate permease n=1 Tax=Amycolatopsis sp. TaxID=37632 RepID=UPI002F40C941